MVDVPVTGAPTRAAIPPWFWVLARAVALAAVYAGVYELITVETSFGTSVGATSNCLEPLLSATLLRRWLPGRPALSRLRELGLFYGAAAVCGPMLSATVGSLWYSALGGGAIWPFAGRWYVGDALGVIVVAPLLLVIAGTSYRPSLNFARKCAYALTFAMIALALPWGFTASVGLPFLVIPALSVTGLLLGTRAAALAVFVAGAVVETLTTIGEGPFSGVGPFTGLLPAQMFLVACSASGLTAAALMVGLASREKMALHDSLTGLANRRLLLDRV